MGNCLGWICPCWRHDRYTPVNEVTIDGTYPRASNGSSTRGGAHQQSRPAMPRTVPPSPSGSNSSGYGRCQQPFKCKYELTDVIGVGSTSTVHRCTEKLTGREFACKIIDKRMIETRFRGLLDQFQIEIGVLKTLNHPNIIHLEDVYETDTKIYMIMELMRGGELFDYVVEKGTLSEEEASDLVRRLASAIAYMHSLEIIHRDLKPENLLLTHRGPDAEVKIIDFGLSKILSGSMAKSFLGTRGYLAPEMLQRQTYSKTIDVWALGVIVFVLLCGCLPFDDDSAKMSSESVQQKFQLRFPSWASNLSSGAKDLLCHLLDINPRTRYTAEQALSHPWVNGNVKANNYLQSPKGIRRIKEQCLSPSTSGGTGSSSSFLRQGGSSVGPSGQGGGASLARYQAGGQTPPTAGSHMRYAAASTYGSTAAPEEGSGKQMVYQNGGSIPTAAVAYSSNGVVGGSSRVNGASNSGSGGSGSKANSSNSAYVIPKHIRTHST